MTGAGILVERLKQAIRLAEAALTPRRVTLDLSGRAVHFTRSLWWDALTPEVFEREMGPYFQCLDLSRPRRVILDVGAASGWFTLAAGLGFPGCRVFAFEPSRYQRVLLRRNLRRNGMAAHAQIEPYAAWNREETMAFRTLGAMSALRSAGTLPESLAFAERTPAVPLDLWCARRRVGKIDLVKMDIEGAEIEALEGMGELLVRDHPELLIQAYHFRGASRTYERVAGFVEALGYRARECPPGSGLLHAERAP